MYLGVNVHVCVGMYVNMWLIVSLLCLKMIAYVFIFCEFLINTVIKGCVKYLKDVI